MVGDKKKRDSNSVEEVVDVVDLDADIDEVVLPEPSKKKMKKEGSSGNSGNDASAVASSVKPMERQKKRKAMDKERHIAYSESAVSKLQNKQIELKARLGSVPMASLTSNVLPLPEFHITVFKDLASVDATARESAVEAMVTELHDVQEAYDKLDKSEVINGGLPLEAEKDDGLNNCAPSVRYAVRRLIRGVSSSRECARQGFALGLTVLLSKISSIQVGSLMKLIVNLLEVTSSMKGHEVKDCLLGRLFAYGALVRSGRLIEEWHSDKDTPHIKEFTGLIVLLASKKRYLQEPAVKLIVDLVEKLPSAAVSNHILETPGLHEWFAGAMEVGNPDALLLALKLRVRVSDDSLAFTNLLPNPFGYEKLFANDYLSSLSNCLKESTFCQPRVHSVWPVLLNILLPDTVLHDEEAASGSNLTKKYRNGRRSGSSGEDFVKSFHNFYEVIIEGSLLQSSHDRKHLALDVLRLIIRRLPVSLFPIIFSHKLVQCLMDILSTKDSWLYKVALHFLRELSDLLREGDSRRVSVILALQKRSNGKFDCITQTKTVKNLMAEFQTESGCMMFIQNVMSIYVDEEEASEEPSDQSQTTDDNSEIGSVEDKESIGTVANSESLKGWVIEALPSILKHLNFDSEANLRVQKEVLKFLAVQGIFSASLGSEVTSFELKEKFRWPKVATSNSLCRMCVEQLQLLLANAQKAEGPHPVVNDLDQNDLGSYFMCFLSTLLNIPSVSLFRTLCNEEEKALKRLQGTERRLSIEERNCGLNIDASKFHALRYLLIQLVLQMLLQPGEFAESASEIIMCCKKFLVAPNILDSSEDEMDANKTPELMDVLIDTLLSLLPQSSSPIRYAIEQVFRHFCQNVTNDGLVRMLRVIRKDLKPARRHGDLSETDDDEDDCLGIEEGEESDEADTNETGESDGQTDDSETVVGVQAAGEEHPVDSDESDSGMDDDAMFRMDSYLVKIFRERKNQAGGETAHSQLVLFKLRVLSLLEIYLHENPGKPQVLTVYSNLAQAFVDPHTVEGSDQLGQRLWGILQKKIFKAKDYPKGETVQLSTLESLLEKNLKLASRPFKKKKTASDPSKKKQSASQNRHKMIISLAQNSSFWLLSIITARNFAVHERQRILNIFEDVFISYFESKKSQLKSGFLKEIFRRRPWVGHQLFGFLLEKCGNAKLEFRRVEALDLVIDILKSMVPSSADEHSQDGLSKNLKSHLPKLSHMIKELATSMPEKSSRQAEVRKFCGKVFQIVSAHKLNNLFLKDFTPDALAVCDSKLGEVFVAFKKQGQ